MIHRTPWQGMVSIARFNWPFYLSAAIIAVLSIIAFFLSDHVWLQLACLFAWLGSFYFIFVSLGASHWIYDRSDVYRFKWLKEALKDCERQRIIFCHSGFDDASGLLKQEYPESDFRVLDHYDPATMTEASIRRARKAFPPSADTIAVPHNCWTTEDGWADVVLGFLAIHEFRKVEERVAWFREAKRCLKPSGKIIIIEHQRDFANFLAFGPGFLHFHSARSWRESWEGAGLRETKRFRVSPWIQVSVIEPS